MALRAHQGKVWAIEKKEDAVELIRQNKVKFAADNLEIIEGLAPEALTDLPAPTHAFIGGSSGNLKEIVRLLIEKNPQIRIVINCITLETVSEALETAKEFGFEENEIVQLKCSTFKGNRTLPYDDGRESDLYHYIAESYRSGEALKENQNEDSKNIACSRSQR